MAEIIDYTDTAKVNPYTQDVADLIAAGDGHAAKITVSAEKVKNDALKFRQAANAADKTAKQRETIDNGDSTFSLVFTLTERYKKGVTKPVAAADAVGIDEEKSLPAEEFDAANVDAKEPAAHKRR